MSHSCSKHDCYPCHVCFREDMVAALRTLPQGDKWVDLLVRHPTYITYEMISQLMLIELLADISRPNIELALPPLDVKNPS